MSTGEVVVFNDYSKYLYQFPAVFFSIHIKYLEMTFMVYRVI